MLRCRPPDDALIARRNRGRLGRAGDMAHVAIGDLADPSRGTSVRRATRPARTGRAYAMPPHGAPTSQEVEDSVFVCGHLDMRCRPRPGLVQEITRSEDGCFQGERRGPDSNRCTRLCRPLPNLSATAPGDVACY